MSEQSPQQQYSRIRQKFRELRQELPTTFRKPQRGNPENVPVPTPVPLDLISPLRSSSPPKLSIEPTDTTIPDINAGMDGSGDPFFGRGHKSQNPANVSAIFVHAGAGYHSTTNEHVHLGACNE